MNARYDFIIIGAGTAGCVLAHRLSEDPESSVLLVEAGTNRLNDPRLSIPGGASATYGNTEFDWAFTSVPQTSLHGKKITYPRGKTVGGSSAINILALAYPDKSLIDAWGSLGNEGWSWDDLLPYYRKFHTYHEPTEDSREALGIGCTDKTLQGTSGPILSSFPNFVSPLSKAWISTLANLGWPPSRDPISGSAIGGFSQPYTVDPEKVIRSHAGNAYYKSVANRPNLRLEDGAQVLSILFDKSGDIPLATGVALIKNGVRRTFHSCKEVILSAGTFHTPQILQLSGIGPKALLDNFKVTLVFDNPNVGENMQDHVMSGIVAQVRDDVPTGDLRRDEAFLVRAKAMYDEQRTGPLTMGFPSFAFLPLAGWADLSGLDDVVAEHATGAVEGDTRPSQAEQADILQRIVLSPHEASVQLNLGATQMHFDKSSYQDVFAVKEPENFVTIMAVLPHPFAAGTCHIVSADASVLPAVDPNFMSHPLDVEILARHTAALEKILHTAPLVELIEPDGRRLPEASGLFTAGEGAERIQAARDHVTTFVRSMSHPTGTASMLPFEKGGVVDSTLLVYGVSGLRVVDASVFPMIPKGNIQSTVYAVAERAADFIKKKWYLKG